MKKGLFLSVGILFCCLSLMFSCAAEQRTAYSWYCKHVKDHVQPTLGGELSFVEQHGGYFIDRRHTDPSDAEKVIYLTFDAGYENGNVAKILDVLKAEGVPAAFFVLGYLIRHDTALVRRMADEGHLVCNHTASHKDMTQRSDADFLAELQALESLYSERIGGELSHYYRPPEGRFSQENLACANQNGYKTIFWSFAYVDWNNEKQPSPERAKQIILDNIHNGEVMLLHPTSATNAAVLGDVIRELKGMGYRFGTLDELCGAEG